MGSIRLIPRPQAPAPEPPPSEPTDTLTLSDFTYLGSYKIPDPSPAGGSPGWTFGYLGGPQGLTVKYEGGEVHLMTAIGNTTSGHMGHVFEWLDHTPEIPASPNEPSSYSTATMKQEYGNIYGTSGVNFKRLMYYNDNLTEFNNAGLTANGSIYWDATDSRLYWCYNFSYGSGTLSENQQFCLGYSELNYSNGTSTPHGPWRLSATQHKACNAGFVPIPSSFISDNSLGSKRLGVVGSMQASTIAAGGFSMGPALTAFNPTLGPELTEINDSQRLLGYIPWTTAPSGSSTRPDRYYDRDDNIGWLDYAWPVDKWWNQDFTQGGVWIHGATKSGFVAFGHMCYGYALYVSASQYSEGAYHQLNIYSENDLASVALGNAEPNEIYPTIYDFTSLPVDYSGMRAQIGPAITSITSNAGDIMNTYETGAIVTTSGPHGIPSSNYRLTIHGSDVDDYNNGWIANSIDTTHFNIYNASTTRHSSGTTATTGHVYNSGPELALPFGTAFDPVTKKFYVGWCNFHTSPLAGMISVYQVDC